MKTSLAMLVMVVLSFEYFSLAHRLNHYFVYPCSRFQVKKNQPNIYLRTQPLGRVRKNRFLEKLNEIALVRPSGRKDTSTFTALTHPQLQPDIIWKENLGGFSSLFSCLPSLLSSKDWQPQK